MQDPYLNSVLEALAAEAASPEGPHLISVDELRAAGALDVPAAWRKSLANESRYTLPGFGDDEEDTDSQVDERSEPVEEYVRTDQAHESAASPSHERKSAPHSHPSRTAK